MSEIILIGCKTQIGKTGMTYVAEIHSIEVIRAVKYKGSVLFCLGFEGNIRQKKWVCLLLTDPL